MQIFGYIKNNKNIFEFYSISSAGEKLRSRETYNINGQAIFIYIDGTVSKLSEKINEISIEYKSVEAKLAYLYYLGFDFESHICGSFNIFIFDYNNKNFRILRDSRGTRAIYYSNYENNFIFSSNQNFIIKQIPKISLNQNKLIDFLNWDYKSDAQTYFQEIKRVEPKHFLDYCDGNLISKKYELSNELFRDLENKNLQEKFKEFLYRSVNNFAKKEKKTGVLMSGGLDSSSIAIALKENRFKDIRTYSANFNHVSDCNNIDESEFQKNITKYTSFFHTSIQMEGKSPITPVKKFTKILSQPIIFPNIYIFEQIIRKLKEDDIEMILDGNDGDNTISHGFEVIYYYFKNFRIFRYVKEIYLYSKFKKTNFIRLLYIFTIQAMKTILKIKPNESKNSILKENLKLKKNPKNLITFFSSHEKKLSIDLHYLGNENRNELFRYFEIENFSPFYDEELIYFCINLPNTKKFNHGYTRKILRDFLLEFLPLSHAYRDKSSLTEGLLTNFSSYDLKQIKEESININKNLSVLLDVQKIKNLIVNLQNGNTINEEELIDLQIFVSANTFLNHFNL